MNARVRPDDLEISPYKEAVQTLALEWTQANLPAQGLIYPDYIKAIQVLLLTTQNPDRTALIVRTIVAQAVNLQKTSAWVEHELQFEGMLEGADRTDFLRFELQQMNQVNDAVLDRYNERINRFQTAK